MKKTVFHGSFRNKLLCSMIKYIMLSVKKSKQERSLRILNEG